MKITVCAAFIFFATVGSQANSGPISGDLACEQAVPPMISFVSKIPSIIEAFDGVYGDFSADDKKRFDPVRKAGDDMLEATKAYRAAFLKACYGN